MKDWLPVNQTKRILITGVEGLIGRATRTLLASKGYTTVGVGRHVAKSNSPVGSFERLDLLSDKAANQLDLLAPFDVVVHCAAVVPKSFAGDEALRAGEANAAIDQTVIDHCVRQNTRLIYCSSSAVYGPKAGAASIVDEDHPVDDASSHYCAAKILSEVRVREQIRSFAILRICAPYGPGQSTRTVLKIFIEAAMAGKTLRYHGSGSREQDFVHAADVAQAIQSAIERVNVTGTFNVAGGSPISMRELAGMVVEVVGNPASSVECSGESDPQENYRARFDTTRAKKMLDWTPKITLREGITEWAKQIGGQAI